ncbi:MAG: type II toxin-antitoxin system VapC family toxin [Stellaceae bacterium]
MILVDTSVWIDHFRVGDKRLAGILETGSVLAHPFVVAEIALSNPPRRQTILRRLRGLPQAETVTAREVMLFIEEHSLFGQGIGFVDVHLLAACRLTSDTLLWTRDRRLKSVAERLGLAADG